LKLRHGARSVEVTRQRPIVSLGRADTNEMVVDHELVSRLHARIEYRKGRFILIDLSTNGTYVRDARGEESFVRRDQLVLPGDGTIGLGRTPDGSADVISFGHVNAPATGSPDTA
jgi:pSer/pThr/pTyr-binding forkhead associated (FHA) protein